MKGKIEELETNSKINNIRYLYRGIIDVKKGYQPRTGIVKDEKGDLVAASHSIMARWRCCIVDRHCFFFSARLWYVLHASQSLFHHAELSPFCN